MPRKNNQTIDNLNQLFIHEIQDLYSAENQIIKVLPKIAKLVSNPELKQSLKDHLQETKYQVERLNKVFHLIKETPKNLYCLGMDGIFQEAEEVLSLVTNSVVRDAAIIALAQKVEHYEITSYGSAKAHAEELDYDDIAHLLDETLEEEKNADKVLSKIGEGSFFHTGINKQALGSEGLVGAGKSSSKTKKS